MHLFNLFLCTFNMDKIFGGRCTHEGVRSTFMKPKLFQYFIILFYYYSYSIIGIEGGGLRGPPRILSSELKPLQVVRLGQEFRVTCPVEGEPSPIVDWYKDGEPISHWFRYRFSGKTLRIRPVLSEDSGMIECKGVNGFGSQITRMRLLVVDDASTLESPDNAPTRKRFDTSKSVTNVLPVFSPETLEQAGPMHLSSGNTIRFRCETKGIPMPKLAWLKDGKPIGEGDNMWRLSSWTLVLNKLVSYDSGNYTCKTDGKKSIEFSIQLHVTEMVEKKRPELASGFPNNTSVLAGNEAILECIVRSGFTTMPPHIKWLKRVSENQGSAQTVGQKHRLLPVENQHVLVIQETQDEGIRIKEFQRNGTFVSKLIISKAELVDHGVYICLATNNVGYTFKEARLTVSAAVAEIGNQTNISTIPFPLIVIFLSISVALLVIGAAYTLRKHQEHQSKQIKSVNTTKEVSKATTSSIHSTSSSYRHPKVKTGCEQQQLLVSTTSTHSSSSSSDGHQHRQGTGTGSHSTCQNRLITEREPIVEIAMSRCSCYVDDTSLPTPPPRSYVEHGFNNSFIGSTNHSLHFGHWT